MEVHHHPHVEKKNFKEYFLEFLMIFLAVTMGFIAENIRESISNRTKEKEYIVSMIKDLKTDTAGINKHADYRRDRKIKLDSLSLLFKLPDYTNYTGLIYYYARWVPRAYFFNTNDGTMQQLKNSGGMQLITHSAAVSAINNYDAQVKILNTQTREIENGEVTEFTHLMTSVFDGNILDEMYGDSLLTKPAGNPSLITNDKATIAKIISQLHFVKSLNNRNIYFENKLKQQAVNTIDILQKEYHLKDE